MLPSKLQRGKTKTRAWIENQLSAPMLTTGTQRRKAWEWGYRCTGDKA